jgi:hypothetical protein
VSVRAMTDAEGKSISTEPAIHRSSQAPTRSRGCPSEPSFEAEDPSVRSVSSRTSRTRHPSGERSTMAPRQRSAPPSGQITATAAGFR